MLRPAGPFLPLRSDWVQAGAIAAGLFLLYAFTAPRSVATEDDALFVLSSYFLGVEHPPGFPLHTLLGKLFTLLPLGSVAYRVHLLSALFGALTCGLLWMCARTLVAGRLAAYLAALGLGLSPVFWSQSLIAEAYTLNTFFFALLMLLGLRGEARLLPWMALGLGLSLANHWPLMVLAAPAFVFLLWPLRTELAGRLGLLSWLVILGLAPYAWMVYRSWRALPVSFYGPLETLPEVWYFLSRAGYAEIDQSPTAGWIDRLQLLRFFSGELLRQFAVAGTLLAACGFAVQWRVLGRRVAGFFTMAFLMPSVVLLMLLRFDYDLLTKHVFHVYPLPAYAVAALWFGLGGAWLARRLSASRAHAAAAASVVIALVAAVGARDNLSSSADWASRYGHAVLDALPRDAVLFLEGDNDLPIAYLHLVENVRPDVTLRHGRGLLFGNRLFHFLRTDDREAKRQLREFVERERRPVAFTVEPPAGHARLDRWLYAEIDRSGAGPGVVKVDVPERSVRFFEEHVLEPGTARDAWVAYHRGELRRRYAKLLGRRLSLDRPTDERTRGHLEVLSRDFHGALGLAEGLLVNPEGYPAPVLNDLIWRAGERLPPDARKPERAGYFYTRAALWLRVGDHAAAMRDLEMAVALWPVRDNPAKQGLEDLRRALEAKR